MGDRVSHPRDVGQLVGEEMLDQIREILFEIDEDIGDVYLVGSFADPSKEVTEGSDVDIYADADADLLGYDFKIRDGPIGRVVEVFSQGDLDEDIETFDDGLELFPEAVEIQK